MATIYSKQIGFTKYKASVNGGLLFFGAGGVNCAGMWVKITPTRISIDISFLNKPMTHEIENNESVISIRTKYRKIVLLSIVIFGLSLALLFILKGTDYFFGGLFIAAIYFFSLLLSKNIDIIEIRENDLIMFKYYSFGVIKKEVTYDMASLYINVKRVVAFKGGVNYYMKFCTTSDNKKIFEISIRDFNNKDDFSFLEGLFSEAPVRGDTNRNY
jgi:hypothetical protein